MKLTLLITALLFLSGCGTYGVLKSHVSGEPTMICVNEVQYLQFPDGVSPAYDSRGQVLNCGAE